MIGWRVFIGMLFFIGAGLLFMALGRFLLAVWQ